MMCEQQVNEASREFGQRQVGIEVCGMRYEFNETTDAVLAVFSAWHGM